ncbi:glycoside hydrolase family 15 protein [Fulvivirgaceae bacterium PWU4]|uniref:Glycoside hydrolase family 15 protein n=1 Tax=Chryseosolibacter histidini TaxID=2782349 RepID=A0AAP2DU90_9BACT|nr:glycoside hydrolase family 15 protein [Chryseosolibacter histidini]MBT1701342.1 glycoside hydrolase family 15 protein [Chryseosolibacter histidini]
MAVHRYNMGIVGNCSYMAYIDTTANVKWMCMPRFDSTFLFGSLLDSKKGGVFSVTPEGDFETRQYYISNTNVLATEFTTAQGKFRVLDCAPRFSQFERFFKPLMLVRKIELLQGNPAVKVKCQPVGAYGADIPETVMGSNHLRFLNLDMQARLTTDISLSYILDQQPFVLDQNCYLVFTYGEPLEAPLKATVEDFINKTVRYWQTWIKSTYVPDLYQEQVIRSALVLKLHQYEDTGGIIASGTTSLPEHHGSVRTWDYRYCWFRDSYYTLKAFNEMGHFDELEGYFEYIQNILMRESDRMQPLYSVTGNKTLEETHLPLEGYLGNQPVRVGNKAYLQIQNDVYGQVLVGLLPLFIDKRLSFTKKHSYKPLVDRLLTWIEKTFFEPDAGLWEFRTVTQVHTYTLLFHWAGCKAAIKIGKIMNDTDLVYRATRLEKIATENIEKCYDPALGVYKQALDADHLDASTLKMITMGYLDPASDKAKRHLEALEKLLKTEQGLFYRYVHQDDFGKPEATFLVCAFWYVDALACVGRVEDAMKTLDTILTFANHLGIFSEDVGLDGSQWGNFPQTYSHVGLINAVFRISKKLDVPNFK